MALLHYAPIRETVGGEPAEIFPFLGSSRLEEPLNRYRPSVVVPRPRASRQPEGATSAGVPVYNVALPLLRRHYPDQPPFRVVEVPLPEDAPAEPPPERRPRARRTSPPRRRARCRHEPRGVPGGAGSGPARSRARPRSTGRFYRRVLGELNAAGVEFLVGGGHALECYLGIGRSVKDLDLFMRERDVPARAAALPGAARVRR